MAKNTKQPPWFKMWLRDKPLIDYMSDAAIGRAVKAAYSYFDTAEMVDIEAEDLALFAMLKSHIDDAYSDYQRDVENGKKGGRPKATGEGDIKPTVKGGNPGYPYQTEEDGEEDGEGEEEEKERENNKEKNIDVLGDREGVGGKEPIPETEEQRKQRMIAMLASYQSG